MIPILNTKQIRELDAYTIGHEPVSSIDLMERACRAFVDWFVQKVDATKKIGMVCGTGNNGGDGLGIARLLKEWGYPVKVWIVKGSVPESPDFKTNFDRIKGKLEIAEIISEPDKTIFEDRDVVIDALFGSGLSRAVEGIYAQAVRCMNASSALKVAVDIPSGLIADAPSSGEIVRANYTVSFQVPKLTFLLPKSFPFTGEWVLVDIGLDKKFIRQSKTTRYLLTAKDIKKILKPRLKTDHKGTYGHALLVAGGFGKMGAAVLSARAVLRAGVGLVTAHVPKCGYTILQTSVPEAMVEVDENENLFSGARASEKYNAIGIGPGLGQDPVTKKGLENLFKSYRKPIVIDADALNILGAHKELQALVPENSILTPHPKEFERLAGSTENDFERLERQRELAARLKSVIVLKGSHSSIATPDGDIFFNSTGNPGMATGGSGDVLTGTLTGLLAQGYSPKNTAILGVYTHGLAGDLCAQSLGMVSMVASDLVEFLPHAFLRAGRD